MVTKTRRQEIGEMLKQRPLSIYELAEVLGVKVNIILDDLNHIKKSLPSSQKILLFPARCQKCGFRFSKRTRLTRPSRCPKCKSERIKAPVIQIVFK